MIDYSRVFASRLACLQDGGYDNLPDFSAMKDLISLAVGEPDFVTPWHIRRAGIDSLERGRTWYTMGVGLAPLRAQISAYLSRRFGLSYDSETETVVTVGGSEAIDLVVRALVNEGDEVILPQPSYVTYAPLTRLCGGVVVPIATRAEDSFRLTAEALQAAITPRTKLLVFPFPNNPTGAVMEHEHLVEIARVLAGTDIMVLSDEIYAELTFTGRRHESIAGLNEDMRARTLVVSGFSKAWAMTGWRLGYVCGPAPVIRQLSLVHDNTVMCAPTTSQYAAVAAMRDGDDDVAEMVADYDMRRRLMVGELARIGLPCFNPNGTFYVFPSVANSGLSSEEFCMKLLEREHLLVVPGTAYGASGQGYVRISYSYSVKHLVEAVGRLERFMNDCREGLV